MLKNVLCLITAALMICGITTGCKKRCTYVRTLNKQVHTYCFDTKGNYTDTVAGKSGDYTVAGEPRYTAKSVKEACESAQGTLEKGLCKEKK